MKEELPVTYKYLSANDVDNPEISNFLHMVFRHVDFESDFWRLNKEKLKNIPLKEKIQALISNKYGALIAVHENKPVGMYTFQDHSSDGSRRVFSDFTHPNHRRRQVALNGLTKIVSDGLKGGITLFYFSKGKNNQNTPPETLARLSKFKELHAARLGVDVDINTGRINKIAKD
ncbi:hypothetical protein HY989_07070 [Candidatus Micrarchaeota archaeon]|nr:hypothetical protein [Candidatus Micrarchaeota archaeon]